MLGVESVCGWVSRYNYGMSICGVLVCVLCVYRAVCVVHMRGVTCRVCLWGRGGWLGGQGIVSHRNKLFFASTNMYYIMSRIFGRGGRGIQKYFFAVF